MGNKEKEEQCLNWAIEAAKNQTGRSRAILSYLSQDEFPRDEAERPDFVKLIPPRGKDKKGILLGIEHFRVDQNSLEKNDGKVASTGALQESRIRNVYEKWHDKIDDKAFMSGIAKDLEAIIVQEHKNRETSSYPTLVRSYEYAFSKHLKNVDIYRENLAKLSDGQYKIELAFLIEIRTYFCDLFFHDKHGVRRQQNGVGPLFYDYIHYIEENVDVRKVNYIVFCITGTLDTKQKLVIATTTSNIRQKLMNANVPIYQYLGTDFLMKPFSGIERNVSVESKIEFQEDHFTYHLHGTQESLDERTRFDLRMYCIYWMSILNKRQVPFVTDAFVQRYYDVLIDHIYGWKKPLYARDDWIIHPVLQDYMPGELDNRFDAFDEKWGYKKNS